jgi:hypothetical protein
MQMDNAAELDTIIASNSSSYTIAEILQDLKVRRRDRCVSMHSCNITFQQPSIFFYLYLPTNSVVTDWPPETPGKLPSRLPKSEAHAKRPKQLRSWVPGIPDPRL